MNKSILPILILFHLGILGVQSQDFATANTYEKAEQPFFAEIEDVLWITGHWQGEALGGLVEEIWSHPAGDAMMGSFRLMKKDTIQFYEFQLIQEIEGTLVVKVKHFNNDLTAWEEKSEYVTFPLVKIEDNRAYFEKLTYEKQDANHLNIYLAMKTKTGFHEVVFRYIRINR